MTDMDDILKTRTQFTNEQWFSLPMPLRVRWWSETDYGKNMPTDDLMTEIKAVLGNGQSTSGSGK